MKRLICTFYFIAGVFALSTDIFGQPDAPSNLVAITVSSSQINLSWQDNVTTDDNFTIERKIGAAGAYSVIDTIRTANTTVYSDFGLAAGTNYFYRVRAYNDDGYSAYTNEADATTLPDPTAAPSNLTATAVSNSQINLTWQDNATDETGFTVERLEDDDFSEIATLPANTTSYSNTGLAASTEYTYRVQAFNASGNSAYSDAADDKTFPNAPSSLAATAVSIRQINLTWNDNSTDESGVLIERKIGAGGTYSQIDAVEADVTSYSDVGLAASTNHYYRVRAYNDEFADSSAYSNESNATTFNLAPTLTSIAPNKGDRLQTLDVIFTGTNFIDGVSLVSFGADITLNSTIVNSATQITANITIGAAATLGARNVSITNSGPGGGTSSIQIFTVNDFSPEAPSNLAATAVSDSRINLTWQDNSTNETGFKIERKTGAGSAYSQIDSVSGNVTSYSNTGLTSLTIYFYRVRAYNAGGNSASSNEENATTPPNPPDAPSNLAAVAISTSEIELTWEDNSSLESGFKIERKIGASSAYSEINSVGDDQTDYSDVDLAANTNYFYRVKAYNSGGNSAPSNESNATTFNPEPTLTNLSPNRGNRLQTLDVVFTGTNFIDGVTSVGEYDSLSSGGGTSIVGVIINSTVVNSSTRLTANLTITAAAATGAKALIVTNSGPGGGSSDFQLFAVNNPTPILTSLSPTNGNRLQTLDVILTGTNFIDGVSVVSFGADITVNSTVVNSATQITANITIGATAALGPRNVSITNSGPGGGTSANQTFTVGNNPAPTLTSIAPINGKRLQTLDVIFTGTNFISGVTSVNVGSDISVNSTTVNSSTSLMVNLTITAVAATGARNFSVTNSAPGGGTSANQTFTVNNPAPTVTSISPTNGNRLQTLDVILMGKNFIEGISAVSFGADITVNSTVVNSATQITANITIGAAATLGARNVSITNSGPGGGTSTNQTFTVGNNPAPTLTSIAPINGNRLQTLDVVFTGTNFINGVTTVNAGDGITVNSITVNSVTSLTANLTIAANAATGARDFSITNSSPGGGTSANQTFTVNNPGPILTSLSPTNGNRLQTLDVILTGTNFIDGVSVVSFGADITVNSTVVNSATQITANITIGATAALGPRNVSITNSGPGGGTSANQTFTIGNNPAPTLTNISSTSGNRLQTLDVIFTGTNFISGVTSVNVGSDISVNSTTVNSSTSLTVNLTITAVAATGARNFSVTNSAPGGGTSANQTFTVNNPAPILTSLSPTNGIRSQTLDVALTGNNFISGVSSVNFGANITLNSTTVNSATQITANITISAAATLGARNVSITNSSPGGGTSANQTFAVGNNNNPVPTLASLAPNFGKRLQRLDVVFTGTNFIDGVSAINAGTGITVNSVTVNSATSLTANLTITAAAATGPRNFSVTNGGLGGPTSGNRIFTVNNPRPTLVNPTPNNGKRLQTLDVVFKGTNFIRDVTTVNVGPGITVNSTTVNDSASLTANLTITAAIATGATSFFLSNGGPGGGISGSRTFTVNNPAPAVTSISPDNGNRLQTFEAVLTGTNFIGGVSAVSFGPGITVNSTVVNSPTQITATITLLANAALGARNVSVTNAPPGGATAILPNGFRIAGNPIPTLTEMTPMIGNRLQTLDVVFTGTNFISGITTVKAGNGITVNSRTVDPASGGTRMTANLTITAAAAAGPRNFSITNSGPGGGNSTNQIFAVENPAPTVTSIAPASGARLQTLNVVFTGANFISGVTAVNAGAGVTINSTKVNNATSLTANLTISAGAAAEAQNFSLTNGGPGGGTSTDQTFTVHNPRPTLTSLSPPTAQRLQTLNVILTGTNFITGVSAVNFGSGITLNSLTVNSAVKITANITIGANAALGSRDVAVSNAAPSGGTATLANGFVIGSNPAPTLTGVSPPTGNRLQSLEVILTGTNFISGISAVNFGAGITVNSTTVISARQITAKITIGAEAAFGSRDVAVINAPPGGGTATLSNGFTVGSNPAPSLTSLAPNNGGRLQTLNVVFTGTNFISGVTTVNVGPGVVVNSAKVNNSTSLTANLTITGDAALGAQNFSLTNSEPGGGTSGVQTFTVNNPSPTLTSLSPPTGRRLQTLEVVLRGTNFINGVSTIDWGADIAVNAMTFNSATQITANITIGANAALGARSIAVTNAAPGGGTATLPNGFTIGSNPAPTLASMMPTTGKRLETLDVVFTGTNFIEGATTVNAGNGIAVNATTINSSTSLTANLTITAAAANGARSFSISNSGPGGGNSANRTFTINNPAPMLTSVAPAEGNRLQRLEVIFTGTNFIAGVTSINAGNGIAVNSMIVNNSTSLTANLTLTAEAAAGARNFSVINSGPGGGNSAPQTFTVNVLPAAPVSPTNLIAEAMGMSQINLRWTDNSSNETGFKIVRRVGTIVPEVSFFTVGPNVQTYQDTELNLGATAAYQVLAYNAGGESPPSNFAGEITATGIRCDVTRNFIVDAGDVDFAIKFILQNSVKRPAYLDSLLTDTNRDGKINVIDVVDIVNESLKYLLASTESPRESHRVETGGELRLGAAEIVVGATIKLPLTISVTEPVAAMQLRIKSDSRALALGDPVLSAGNPGMTLATARGPDQLAVLIYSLSGGCLASGSRELLQLSLQAKSADFSQTGLQIESALLIGKSGKPIPVQLVNEAANLKINLPDKFVLSQNYPNPFNTAAANSPTEIVYTVPTAATVKLAIYNVLGHEVAVLVDSWQTLGVKKVSWNGRDRRGKRVTAGIYFYRLEAGDLVAKQKMVLK